MRIIGLDVGGAKLAGVLTDGEGHFFDQVQARPGPSPARGPARHVGGDGRTLAAESGERPAAVSSASPPGGSGAGSRDLRAEHRAGRYPLGDRLSGATGFPATVDNDVNCAIPARPPPARPRGSGTSGPAGGDGHRLRHRQRRPAGARGPGVGAEAGHDLHPRRSPVRLRAARLLRGLRRGTFHRGHDRRGPPGPLRIAALPGAGQEPVPGLEVHERGRSRRAADLDEAVLTLRVS